MTSNKLITLDISWSYPCVCLTGSQFWGSSLKILVAKKSEMPNLRKGKGKIQKAAKTGDILEQLRRIILDDSEEEDNFNCGYSPSVHQLLSDLYRDKSQQELYGRRSCLSIVVNFKVFHLFKYRVFTRCSVRVPLRCYGMHHLS